MRWIAFAVACAIGLAIGTYFALWHEPNDAERTFPEYVKKLAGTGLDVTFKGNRVTVHGDCDDLKARFHGGPLTPMKGWYVVCPGGPFRGNGWEVDRR